MGIDVYVLELLSRFKATVPGGLGDALTLGRQILHFPNEESRVEAAKVLRRHDPAADFGIIRDSGVFAEPLLRYLGCRSVRAMDFSSYEGADIEHDLNDPVPAALIGAFDFILDGGKIEHVFDIPMAYRNVRAMLREGGLFIGVNPANNYLGHGLYQFSPELVWRVFSGANGFQIQSVEIVPVAGPPLPIEAPNPGAARRRPQIGVTPERCYVTVAARKMVSVERAVAQHGDHVAARSQARAVGD